MILLDIDLTRADALDWRGYRRAIEAMRGPVRLLVKSPDWQCDESFGHPASAIKRLAEIEALAGLDKTVIRQMPHRAIPQDPVSDNASKVGRAMRLVDRHRTRLTASLLERLEEIGVLRRAMVLALDEDTGELTFRYIGLGHAKRMGADWVRDAIGRPHDYTPAHQDRYTNWVAGFYTDTIRRGLPVRHHIDSLIPNVHQRGRQDRVNYDRLLAPARMVDGAPALLLLSEVRPGLLPLAPYNC